MKVLQPSSSWQPDFKGLYDHEPTSDVTIHISQEETHESQAEDDKVQEPDSRPTKCRITCREPDVSIHGHKVVLWAHSDVLRAKIEHWSSTGTAGCSGRPEIKLIVPAGQFEVGTALVKGMYGIQVQLTQVQQLQLLQLAESYNVGQIVHATSQTLGSLSPDQLEWSTTVEIYRLPEICAANPAYAAVYSIAAAKLHKDLGDLEMCNRRGTGVTRLTQLPFAGLKQLLSDERTAVASEDTVWTAVHMWLAKNHCEAHQRQQLAALLRVGQCSPLFSSTVVCQPGTWFADCLDAGSLVTAASLSWSRQAKHGLDMQALRRLQLDCNLNGRPGWSFPPRPASAIGRIKAQWALPLKVLQAAFAAARECRRATPLQPVRVFYDGDSTSPINQLLWQGKGVELILSLRLDALPAEGSLGLSPSAVLVRIELALQLEVPHRPASTDQRACTSADGLVIVYKTTQSMQVGAFQRAVLVKGKPTQIGDFELQQPVEDWPALEQQLRSQDFVYDNQYLGFEANIASLV